MEVTVVSSDGASARPTTTSNVSTGAEVLFSIISRSSLRKDLAKLLLEYLQYVYGQVDISLMTFGKFNLTEPFPGEKIRKWTQSSHRSRLNKDSTLVEIVQTKQAVAQRHISLQESWVVHAPEMSLGYDQSLWTQFSAVMCDRRFRAAPNFMAREFCREDKGDDLCHFKNIRTMYIELQPILEELLGKLRAGLEHEEGWVVDRTELVDSEPLEYRLDCDAGEAERERKQRRASPTLNAPENSEWTNYS
ncbi:hypothetical protein N0V90_006347 [Kalmusia sp. IMI 367209]|nr:hypothetical protein N0V90_006347 [Kalmusia sp. IMI 367209]